MRETLWILETARAESQRKGLSLPFPVIAALRARLKYTSPRLLPDVSPSSDNCSSLPLATVRGARRCGKAVFPGGHTYEGEWHGGQRCGFGEFRTAGGDVYIGEWRDDAVHGEVPMPYMVRYRIMTMMQLRAVPSSGEGRAVGWTFASKRKRGATGIDSSGISRPREERV